MRALAIAALGASFATAGCNKILGLNDVRERDGSPGIDSPDPTFYPISLTWQVLNNDGSVTYDVIDTATTTVQVQVGPVDPAVPLTTVNLNMDGTFYVPGDLPTATYRIVYTINGVTTELHSQLNTGHLVVPIIGRVKRDPPPAHAMITFNPAGAPSYFDARVYTTGLWTAADLGAMPGPDATWDYQAGSISLSGPQGSLQAAAGDVEVLTTLNGNNHNATGYAVMSVDHLQPNGSGPVTMPSVWSVTPPIKLAYTQPPSGGMLSPTVRLNNSLNSLYVSGAPRTYAYVSGVAATNKMTVFTDARPGALDPAVFFTLSNDTVSPQQFVNPFTGSPAPLLPTATYAIDTDTRNVHGVDLTSGLEEVALNAACTVCNSPVMLTYPVGIPTAGVKFGVTGDQHDLTPALSHTGDVGVSFGGQKLVDLNFATDIAIDDCVVTLYAFDNNALTLVRRYLMLDTPASKPFRIPSDVFDQAHSYTFGITCRTGLPGASSGDYTKPASDPQAESTIYSDAFTVTL